MKAGDLRLDFIFFFPLPFTDNIIKIKTIYGLKCVEHTSESDV